MRVRLAHHPRYPSLGETMAFLIEGGIYCYREVSDGGVEISELNTPSLKTSALLELAADLTSLALERKEKEKEQRLYSIRLSELYEVIRRGERRHE